jgi:serine/threonine-protein kinase RsbW
MMTEAEWRLTFIKQIESSKDAAHELIDQMLVAMSDAGWEGREYFHVQMALEEAMVNAVTHGNKEAPDKVVEVEFKLRADLVFIRITDQGEGFRPEDLPDPRDEEHLECTNGRGVMLIRAMMDEVSYNGVGNEVVMIKSRG